MHKITENDCAMINIDLIAALVIVMATVIMAIQIMPSLSHPTLSQEDKDWRIERYMAATRASDSLVQDKGQSGWETNWTRPNYLNVTKIGLVYVDADDKAVPKVLSETKIDTLMARYTDGGTLLPWWEFPNSTKPWAERQDEQMNASRALGLEGYNFYIQLHPVGLDNFNLVPLEEILANRSKVPINDNAVSVVDRYVYIKDDSCAGAYLCYNNITVHYRLNLWVW